MAEIGRGLHEELIRGFNFETRSFGRGLTIGQGEDRREFARVTELDDGNLEVQLRVHHDGRTGDNEWTFRTTGAYDVPGVLFNLDGTTHQEMAAALRHLADHARDATIAARLRLQARRLEDYHGIGRPEPGNAPF